MPVANGTEEPLRATVERTEYDDTRARTRTATAPSGVL